MSDFAKEDSDHAARNAFIVPFLVFMGFLMLNGVVARVAADLATARDAALPLWLAEPRYWVFPLQTVVCGFLLIRYRRFYSFGGISRPVLATLAGLLALVIWISPQEWFGHEARTNGFDPSLFDEQPMLYGIVLAVRFVRLVVVVPFLEEIFWRGFLLRYLIDNQYQKVPFGTFSPFSFALVTLFFGLAHWGPDFWPAIAAGLIYNALAIHTRSLGACVWAHALTNLILGIYIMRTGQWGFW